MFRGGGLLFSGLFLTNDAVCGRGGGGEDKDRGRGGGGGLLFSGENNTGGGGGVRLKPGLFGSWLSCISREKPL